MNIIILYSLQLLYFFKDDFDGWDDADWGWKDDDQMDTSSSDVPVQVLTDEDSCSWLQKAYVSISPTADFIAVAYDAKLVLTACE